MIVKSEEADCGDEEKKTFSGEIFLVFIQQTPKYKSNWTLTCSLHVFQLLLNLDRNITEDPQACHYRPPSFSRLRIHISFGISDGS